MCCLVTRLRVGDFCVLEIDCSLCILLLVELEHATIQKEVFDAEDVLVVVREGLEAFAALAPVRWLLVVDCQRGELGPLLYWQLLFLLFKVFGNHGLFDLDPFDIRDHLDVEDGVTSLQLRQFF